MASPTDRRYSTTNEWVMLSTDGTTATLGVTAYAAGLLGTVSAVSMPTSGSYTQGQQIGSITGALTSSKFVAPVGGNVIDRNERLLDSPSTINTDPYGTGWTVQMGSFDMTQYNALMTGPQYDQYIQTHS